MARLAWLESERFKQEAELSLLLKKKLFLRELSVHTQTNSNLCVE
jgi:hypothetical protein